MEDNGGARISETGELWAIEEFYPQRNSGSECRMRGQSTSDRNSVSPDRSQTDSGAAELLSNSVYLWACDESSSGITPSRSDAYVAWVILITQMACYVQLILVSSGKPQQDLSSTTEGSYSIVSVAVAMYLMTSIAANSTLRGANISVQEMNGVRWLQRKVVGLTLISSFGLLAAASIAVLFKSSFEDVDLVVGAAAVLFIADVDEKAMFVLRIIPSEWRLFWVLEVVGLSVALALLALRVTGHVAEVRGDGHAGCVFEDNQVLFANGCDIYSWYFILAVHPCLVTVVSLLLNAIVASPKRFIEKHVLESYSLQNWVFVFVLVSWVLEPIFYLFEFYGSISGMLFSYRVFFMCYVTLLIWWALGICLRQGSGLPNASNATSRSVWCRSSNTLIRLCLVPTCLSLTAIVLYTADAINVDPSDVFQDVLIVTGPIFIMSLDLWLMWGIFPRGNSVQDEAHETPVPAIGREPGAESNYRGSGKGFKLTTNLIFGWVQTQALFEALDLADTVLAENRERSLIFHAIFILALIGVGICAASSNEKGIAYWSVATWLIIDFDYFISSWVFAKVSRSVEQNSNLVYRCFDGMLDSTFVPETLVKSWNISPTSFI